MPKLIATETIDLIRGKREQGFSINELTKLSRVSKASVWRYIQGIKIRPEYIESWRSKQITSVLRAEQRCEIARIKVDKLLGNKIDSRDKFILLASLYWGEGSKREFNISNSDPRMMKTVKACLLNLGVKDVDIRITLRVFEDMDIESCKKFWAKTLGLPITSILNVNVLTGKKQGKLQYGMCRMRITKGADILKMMHAFSNKVTESL